MIGLLLAIMGAVLLFCFLALRSTNDSRSRAVARSDEAKSDEAQHRLFEESVREEWPVVHAGRSRPDREYFMISADRSRLRWARVQLRPAYTVVDERVVALDTVLSVELQQSSRTVMRLETQAVTKKTGALGRAVVGGVLLGGAGAVIGAATAGGQTTATTKSKSLTRDGPTYVVIGTTDLERPMLKVKMSGVTAGEEWVHRIKASLELQKGDCL